MELRVEEVTEILKKEIREFGRTVQVREKGTVITVGDGIARVYGLSGAMAGELLNFPHGVRGLVLNLEESNVGVALLAATLSVPVAGTGLVVMDPYLTARSLSTPATLFAIAWYLSNRPRLALVWLAVTATLHPQMAVYGLLFLGVMELRRRLSIREVA